MPVSLVPGSSIPGVKGAMGDWDTETAKTRLDQSWCVLLMCCFLVQYDLCVIVISVDVEEIDKAMMRV